MKKELEKKEKKKRKGIVPVYQFDMKKNRVKKFDSTSDAAEALGLTKSQITNAIAHQRLCNGKWYFGRSEVWIDFTGGINPLAARRIIKFFKLDEKEES